MGTKVPYEQTGRIAQKARTRAALLRSAQEILTMGSTPTVEMAAASAGISRTTAYRYFADQKAMIVAAIPELGRGTLLPDPAPTDLTARVEATVRSAIDFAVEWEQALRIALRLSLEDGAGQPTMRGGRVIAWYEAALEPLARSHPRVDRRRLAIAMRSATGIESLIWLTDIAELSRVEAADLMVDSAHALVKAALSEHEHPRSN